MTFYKMIFRKCLSILYSSVLNQQKSELQLKFRNNFFEKSKRIKKSNEMKELKNKTFLHKLCSVVACNFLVLKSTDDIGKRFL